ncbi:macro domain-containing protein [Chamaesiphon minutus]|uniref:Putative phosphatase, C-terminal domain of histone macro H2A1 like protein n=1 Tax=Chamaesiphon minutus (strain ATCC 27169 / PCC 6605) TaxID=1173020 RepID=K9UQ68_CHAP6|nr:macro domain-containing protein [Chamaesiphon minutus]AFY96354.1 putative phosphatase, C-terminal domain of histone macro H2A1 like protein [Chamaesiphon minutus PCC 6605]
MKLILTAVDESLAEAWTKFCGDLDFVTVHHGSILDVDCDAVVSPANSYGFMDGGIDGVYMWHFGDDIQIRVRRQIFDRHHGEILVGQADVVATENVRIPYLIFAPTMRVPMNLQDTVNPYLAARAIFLLVKDGVFKSGEYTGQKISSRIETIALPGLGTGVGNVCFETCARQVRSAIDDIILEGYRMPKSWAEASERHQLLYTKDPTRLQY